MALPSGARFKFRYEHKYITGDARVRLVDSELPLDDCVIAFARKKDRTTPFVMPVRLARLVSREEYGDAVVVELETQEFLALSDWPSESADELAAAGLELSERIRKATRTPPGADLPAVFNYRSELGIDINDVSDSRDAWKATVARLQETTTFGGSFVMRIGLYEDYGRRFRKRRKLPLADGQIRLTSGSTVVLRCWFHSNTLHVDDHTISSRHNKQLLSASSDLTYNVNSRYDVVEFWYQAQAVERPALTQVSLAITPGAGDDDWGTDVALPVLVGPATSRRLTKGIVAGLGAALVAIPSLLAPETDTLPKIIIAAGGAVVIGVVSSVPVN